MSTARQMKEGLRREYDAIRQGAALVDLSDSGLLKLSGRNAIQFLNGLVSNDVKTLEPGHGVPAAFPTLQGKLLALARIYNTGDGLLIEVAPPNREKILNNLKRFVPAGEFFVTDLAGETCLLSLEGPESGALIERLTGCETGAMARYDHNEAMLGRTPVRIAAHGRCGEQGYDIFVPTEEMAVVKHTLTEAGAVAVSDDAFEIARIEAGVPREGVDAGENYIILESELNDAVSYTKGCYLGQEVIARIHWRGQPAKRLRGLLLDIGELPPAGALLYAEDGKKVGEITSSTHSIGLDRDIALGYVHRNYLEPGTRFSIRMDEQEIGRAELAELPLA